MSEAALGELLARAAAGDRSAWETIVDRYHRLVWSVVRAYRLDDASAADVCQTVWERLVTHLDRIRDPNRLPAWLATTAKHEALRVLGQLRRSVPSEIPDEAADRIAIGFEEMVIESETARAAFRAFRRLPPDSQHFLRLLCTDPPLDYQAIAEMVGRPIGSIGPTRQRILDKLRKLMNEDMLHDRGGK
ncbi:MAG: RNA polymerase sigma factor [Acidimicrobiia bacterium]